MDLKQTINQLEHVKGDQSNKIFTMYLNTDPADPEQQGGEWKIHLKNGLNNPESYLKEADDKEELKYFKHVQQKVRDYVFEHEPELLKGLIIFASGDDQFWIAERVHMPVETAFYWEEDPVLDQLKELYASYPRTGIILAQKNQVKVLQAQASEVENRELYELNVDTEQWYRNEGGGPPDAGSMNQEQFKARFDANRHRWFKSLSPKLDKMVKDQGWEKLIIMGESDEAEALNNQMQKTPDNVIYKNMLEHKDKDILDTVFA